MIKLRVRAAHIFLIVCALCGLLSVCSLYLRLFVKALKTQHRFDFVGHD
jgi:hypothetical protein